MQTQVGLDVQAVLAQLSLEEKAALLDGSDYWHTEPIARLGIPRIMVSDGPHGLRKVAAPDDAGIEQSAEATCFPPAAGLGSSWDVELAQRIGLALGEECRVAGVAVLLGPGVNMKRSPLCGRNFEYFSEDPLLAGVLAAAWVNGVQAHGVGASLKHFAANNQESDRLRISAEVDERTLREIYVAAFERVVKQARPWTLMSSYNRINGVYAAESHWLLTELLRDEWGFDGLVVSDWAGIDNRPRALAAGCDLEMPSSEGVGTRAILDAVAAGTLSEAEVDAGVARVLALVGRAGARERLQSFDLEAHHELAREAAAASVVLLKNDGELLPLDPSGGGAIAVIGEFARTPRYQGAGSSQVNPTRLENALDCLRAELAGGRELLFAPGFEIEAEAADLQLVAEAVRIAAEAEVALVFLGLPPSYESEGWDRQHMDLPALQIDLLEQIADVNPNVVVVLSNGAAVVTSAWDHRARALLEGWLLGQAGGRGLADVLLGKVSPSGRLAETIPRRLSDNPALGNFPGEHSIVRYGEGLLIGYRWYDAHELAVSYPFGHGLSYTSFEYSDLDVEVLDVGADPRVEVSLTVTNTGARAGAEVVQLYVGDPVAGVYRPMQELRGFRKVALEPGASSRVTIELDKRAFAYWHVARGGWVVEGGEFQLRVGASSRDIRLTETIMLSGGDVSAPLTVNSTYGEFLARPEAAEWLHGVLRRAPLGERVIGTHLGKMLETVPVKRLARFPGSGFTEQDVAHYLAGRAASARSSACRSTRSPWRS
ncbi:MAG: glycoside hydrolase family 3 C-terminal domain-containing protein [Acidobacteriota bacterium]|nr:glycoside hydrolase family 3 C-terminal domain-containing protein [Acidobacteriota bacterium]